MNASSANGLPGVPWGSQVSARGESQTGVPQVLIKFALIGKNCRLAPRRLFILFHLRYRTRRLGKAEVFQCSPPQPDTSVLICKAV
jgi:hypothetical protein